MKGKEKGMSAVRGILGPFSGLRSPVSSRIAPVVLSLGMIFMVSCQEFLPDAYQEEDFALGLLDARAREILLADTLALPISAFASDALDSLISDSILIYSPEVNWRIAMPGDTGFVALSLDQAAGQGMMVFFCDDIVSMTLTDDEGTEVEAGQSHFPLETFAYAPEIKTRLGFGLSEGESYLIRFITNASSFHVVILQEE